MASTFAALYVLVCVLSVRSMEVLGRSLRSDDTQPLEVVVEQMSQALQSLQAKYDALNSKVTQLEADNMQRVAFSAFITDSGHISASKGAIIPFSSIITNVGNAYNKATGVFTAPFNGDYFFSINLDVSTDYEHVTLRKNGRVVTTADRDDTASTHLSASTVMSLTAGDVVTVNQDVSVGHLDAGNDCTFTGFLVN